MALTPKTLRTHHHLVLVSNICKVVAFFFLSNKFLDETLKGSDQPCDMFLCDSKLFCYYSWYLQTVTVLFFSSYFVICCLICTISINICETELWSVTEGWVSDRLSTSKCWQTLMFCTLKLSIKDSMYR